MAIAWKTPKGNEARLELRTSETTDADGWKVETPCYRLECTVGAYLGINPTVVVHPKAGTCLKSGMREYVPIAPEVLADVTALVNEFWAEWDRRLMAARDEDRKYRKMNAGVCPRCHTYCDGDCQAH